MPANAWWGCPLEKNNWAKGYSYRIYILKICFGLGSLDFSCLVRFGLKREKILSTLERGKVSPSHAILNCCGAMQRAAPAPDLICAPYIAQFTNGGIGTYLTTCIILVLYIHI